MIDASAPSITQKKAGMAGMARVQTLQTLLVYFNIGKRFPKSTISSHKPRLCSCPSRTPNPRSHLPSVLHRTLEMRQLTEEETKTLFTKLAQYTGRSLNNLIAPPASTSSSDASASPAEQHVFRLHKSRVYYMPLSLANLATSIARQNLLSVGTCLGRFTKTGKFRMHITALEVIAPHARHKVWIKANGEMPLLYGGHVLKAHIGRWGGEDIPEHQGVIVCGMNDTPLGFGVTARSTQETKRLEPTAIATFRQADVGEYLREEDTLFATN
jgi:60S ribosome subunit biogenesis protein NIP7